MSQSRSEILREFYESVVSKIDLPELTFVKAVASARVVCWDKLRAIEGIEDLDSITIDWREEILFPFYESINDVLLPGGQSFLKNAPRIRDIVSFYKRVLGNKYPLPLVGIRKLQVNPGDVLVISIKEHYSLAHQVGLQENLIEVFDNVMPGVKKVVMFVDAEFTVIDFQAGEK